MQAFTLIEALIVVMSVVLLAALLLPALCPRQSSLVEDQL
jgi:type II secretory pathway pseudopilin PulG